jgi:AraC-like DNA-binding protein
VDRVLAIGARFGATVQGNRLPHCSLIRLRIEGGRVLFRDMPQYGVTIPLTGPIGIEVGSIEPGAAHLSARGDSVTFDVGGKHAVVAANIDADWLEAEAATAGCAVRGQRRVALRSNGGADLVRFLIGLYEELDRSVSLRCSPHAMAEKEGELADLFLRAASAAPPVDPNPQAEKIRHAEEFMLAHIASPVRVTQVAEAAGVNLRTLHHHFRRRHGMGPAAWLRERRLEEARRELLATEPGQASVTQVATRYGFYHFSRFAQQYRRAFGVRPSETLEL